MKFRVSITAGFITNSSSVIHHIPRALLEHPKVKAFIETYGLEDGFVGEDMWSRNECATIALTPEQKAKVHHNLTHEDFAGYRGPSVDLDTDDVIVVYGDEHPGVASMLVQVIRDAYPDGPCIGGQDYN